MFTGVMESHLGKTLLCDLQLVAARRQINRIAVHILSHRCRLSLQKLVTNIVIRKAQPAGSMYLCRFILGIHVIFALQAVCNYVELQLPHSPQQFAAHTVGKHLYGALFTQFGQAFLQLLGLERIKRAGFTK